jgi:hypothetical protein
MNRTIIILALGAMSLGTLAAAQDPQIQQVPQVPQNPVQVGAQNIELKDTEIPTAVGTISRMYGAKVLAEDGLKGKVTANVRNATLETALTMVSAPNGLAWRKFVLAVKPTDSVTAKTLGDLMRALDTIKYAGLVMQGPQAANPIVFERGTLSGDLA